jgi:hypothetical protein
LSKEKNFSKNDFSVGLHVITLNVTDDNRETASDTVSVTIFAGNEIPIANAGKDQQVEEGTTIILDASASKDSDGKIISYTWSESKKVLGEGETLKVANLNVGIHTITLFVKDDNGGVSSDDVLITVR